MVRPQVNGLDIRIAGPDDAETIHDFVSKLAKYERLSQDCHSSVECLRQELSSPDRVLEAAIVEQQGEPIAFATWFVTYSTFASARGLYIEDLFVIEPKRHQGIGSALLIWLARLAVQRGYGRIEWTTLLWNHQAIEFYESLGANPSDAWTSYRLHGDFLKQLAAMGDQAPAAN